MRRIGRRYVRALSISKILDYFAIKRTAYANAKAAMLGILAA